VSEGGSQFIGIGRIAGPFGVRGWVKIHSYTEPRDNVLRYRPWRLRIADQVTVRKLIEGHAQGQGVVAHLEGCDDREGAEALQGAEIEVDRGALGQPGSQQFFWADLQGMQVRTVSGEELGRVDYLFETGANDVMVVVGARRRLIPFVYGNVVAKVDGPGRLITVDWDPEF
jgi:16S rRNA processing protein RimM